MTQYHKDKQARKEYFYKYVYGWKLGTCAACNGSGHYDHNGSPECSCCNGTGKVRKPPAFPPQLPNDYT